MGKPLQWEKHGRRRTVRDKGYIRSASLCTLPGDPLAQLEAEQRQHRQQRRASFDPSTLDPAVRKRLNQQYRQHRLRLEAIGVRAPDYLDWMAEQASQAATDGQQ